MISSLNLFSNSRNTTVHKINFMNSQPPTHFSFQRQFRNSRGIYAQQNKQIIPPIINNKIGFLDNVIHNIDMPSIPIIIYYHIAEIGNWENIVIEQFKMLKSSGLYDKCIEIRVGFLGNINNILPYLNNKIRLYYHSKNVKEFEHPTINNLLSFAKDTYDEYSILYIHNKGSSSGINNTHVHNWRRLMMYYLVEQHRKCLHYLNTYDTVGCNLCESKNYTCKILNEKHNYHYSGNFWWSKTSYIKKLPYLLDRGCRAKDYRFLAESLLLYRLPNMNCLIIDATPETHLYHKSYNEDYYRKPKQLSTVDKKMKKKQLNILF